MTNKLLLIDTFYFLHRSFHAYPMDLKTSSGEHTNIVFGLAQTLLDSISYHNPTHIACGWESEGQPSFRKVLYPKYQANRIPGDPQDEKIFYDQFPRVIQLLTVFNIPRIVEEGFEGDDVLGTVATHGSEDADVIISTSDQDLLQLITDRIKVYRPSRPPYVKRELFDADKFKEKYGFEPIRMIDYKSLRGDPSDNIPGVKGIGDKTAKLLLKQFGSLNAIYRNLDRVESESVRKKLESSKKEAMLSRQLATIVTNIPMKFDLDACKVHDFDINDVRKFFNELEFKSLNNKLNKLEALMLVKGSLTKKETLSKGNDQMKLI